MTLSCPTCSARLTLADEYAGRPEKKVRCPGCAAVFRLADGRPTGATRPPAPSATADPEASDRSGVVLAVAAPPARAPVSPPVAPAVSSSGVHRIPPPVVPPRSPAASGAPSGTFRVPPQQFPPQVPPRVAPPAPPVADPLATRPMPRFDPPGESAVTLEEAMAGAASPDSGGEKWEIDRADYRGTSFDLEEMKDLVKRGWIDRTDGIRRVATAMWTSAQDHPALARAFALRAKAESAKLATAGNRKPLVCANHPKARARWRCGACGRVFCIQCTNETEIRDRLTQLCVECDEPLTDLTSPL